MKAKQEDSKSKAGSKQKKDEKTKSSPKTRKRGKQQDSPVKRRSKAGKVEEAPPEDGVAARKALYSRKSAAYHKARRLAQEKGLSPGDSTAAAKKASRNLARSMFLAKAYAAQT